MPYQLLPSDVIQIIMKYACHGDIYTVLSFLQAAKTCQKMLDDESWKLLFLKNIHRRRKELFDSNERKQCIFDASNNYIHFSNIYFNLVLGELQNNLSTCPSDYIEAQFYDISSSWKNRYMYCAQLERDGATPEEFKADPDELYDLSENSLVIYKCDNTDTIVYGNLEKIETANNDYIMAMLESTSLEQNGLEVPLENNCTVYQAVIHFSGAPVKIRFETLKEEIGREVEKLYCNSRLLAYNEKTSAWDVSKIYSTKNISEQSPTRSSQIRKLTFCKSRI